MTWSPELEIIDQLLDDDLPLPVVCRLLGSDKSSRKVLGQYVSKGVVVFAQQETVIPLWQSLGLLRSPQPLEQHDQIRVSLTSYGTKMFENEGWDTI